MAATADLATLVTFALDRGASVRLVGDDQQPPPSPPAGAKPASAM